MIGAKSLLTWDCICGCTGAQGDNPRVSSEQQIHLKATEISPATTDTLRDRPRTAAEQVDKCRHGFDHSVASSSISCKTITYRFLEIMNSTSDWFVIVSRGYFAMRCPLSLPHTGAHCQGQAEIPCPLVHRKLQSEERWAAAVAVRVGSGH